MGIEVTVKNRQLFKKALKIKDLTLGKYACGNSDEHMRNTCEVADGDLIIYNPQKIGRGIVALNWCPNIKDEINLRVNFLSTRYDMEMFYEIIRNVMHVWKAKNFEQDGNIFTEDDIDALCRDNKDLSLKYMLEICKDKKTDDSAFTIFGAMFPLDIETDLLINFGFKKDEEGYADYLHRLQSMDVYYAAPRIYRHKDKESVFWGAYTVTATVDTVFPLKPREPFFFKNPDTNKDLKCDFFVVSLYSLVQEKILAIMRFEDFCRLAGVENCQIFDKNHVVIKGISEEKMAEMAASDYVNPLEE